MYIEYLKAKRSQYIGPESKRPYPESFQEFLFEHPLPPPGPVTEVASELLEMPVTQEVSTTTEIPKEVPVVPVEEVSSLSSKANNSNSNNSSNSDSNNSSNSYSNSSSNGSEEDDDCKTVDPIKVQGREIRKYIVALLKDSSKTPEQLIISVIQYLDSKIDRTETYVTKFSNTLTPISVSNARIIITPENFIKKLTANVRGCPGLNYTLKQLIAVNISKFTKENKAAFINFFKKVTDESLHESLTKRMMGGSRRITRRSS